MLPLWTLCRAVEDLEMSTVKVAVVMDDRPVAEAARLSDEVPALNRDLAVSSTDLVKELPAPPSTSADSPVFAALYEFQSLSSDP